MFYHVIVKNNKTGAKFYMTKTPVNHHEACVLLSKLTRYRWRTETLEQVPTVKTTAAQYETPAVGLSGV